MLQASEKMSTDRIFVRQVSKEAEKEALDP